MDIQWVPDSLFLIWRNKGSLIVSLPLVLNPIFWGLKTIMIQYRDIQGALYVFQKYRFCEIIWICFGHKYFSYVISYAFWRQTPVDSKHFRCQNLHVSVMYSNRVVFFSSSWNVDVLSWYVILRDLSCIEFILLLRLLLWNIQINGQ